MKYVIEFSKEEKVEFTSVLSNFDKIDCNQLFLYDEFLYQQSA